MNRHVVVVRFLESVIRIVWDRCPLDDREQPVQEILLRVDQVAPRVVLAEEVRPVGARVIGIGVTSSWAAWSANSSGSIVRCSSR